MPIIGLSQMYGARRNYNGISGTLMPYTDGKRFARAVNYSTEISSTDGNSFYADNDVAENQSGEFSNGTISIETAELGPPESKLILGVTEREIEVDGQKITEYVDTGEATPELGYGVVEKWMVHGAIKWRGVVMPRIAFNVPSDDVTTQGEEIEYQTATIEGVIMREQQFTDGKKLWRRKSGMLDTEEMAAAYVRQILNITGGESSLSGLSIGGGAVSLTPPFSKGVTNYTATTANATNVVSATPSEISSSVEIKVNGTEIANGAAATWQEGENVLIVTIINAGSSSAYTVTVEKGTT